MVAILLLVVAGEADVFSLVLKGDVVQKDGDVASLTGADKLHPIMIDLHIWFYTFSWDDCFTKLMRKMIDSITGDTLTP